MSKQIKEPKYNFGNVGNPSDISARYNTLIMLSRVSELEYLKEFIIYQNCLIDFHYAEKNINLKMRLKNLEQLHEMITTTFNKACRLDYDLFDEFLKKLTPEQKEILINDGYWNTYEEIEHYASLKKPVLDIEDYSLYEGKLSFVEVAKTHMNTVINHTTDSKVSRLCDDVIRLACIYPYVQVLHFLNINLTRLGYEYKVENNNIEFYLISNEIEEQTNYPDTTAYKVAVLIKAGFL